MKQSKSTITSDISNTNMLLKLTTKINGANSFLSEICIEKIASYTILFLYTTSITKQHFKIKLT